MGVLATTIFGVRNMDKVGHGETGRIGAAAAQTTNLVKAASNSTIAPINKGANFVLDKVDDAGRLVGVTGAASKVANVASKAVNPLLCVASGIRILNDDDKYAAIIEEAGAMGSMFAAEKLYKTLISNPISGKELKSGSKLVKNIASKVDDLTKGLTGKKKLAAVLIADLGLVATSIFAFDTGKKLAKKISNREEKQAPNLDMAQYNINSSPNGVYYKS